jgi:hypothetical protein
VPAPAQLSSHSRIRFQHRGGACRLALLSMQRPPALRCFIPAIILRPSTCWPASNRIHPILSASLAPLNETITIAELTRDPYPIYMRLRREAPVLRVKSVGRTFLTKAADTKYVTDDAALFSSDDPNTPMKRAFLAHTLMRKGPRRAPDRTHGDDAGPDAEDDRNRLGAVVCETGGSIS